VTTPARSAQAQVMRLHASGEPSADDTERRARFRHVFENEFDYVWLSLRRLGVADRDLEDVAQNVFLKVYRRLDDYDGSRPARPWLFAFAVRCASDWRRLARHRVEVMGERAEPAASDPAADERMARDEDLALLLRALDHLDIHRRAVLILHELDEVPVKEIAASLHIPLFTVYSRLRVARAELTAALKRIWTKEGKT
jgi:RNA polymerase sigma-70 factor (ECF subfamily)